MSSYSSLWKIILNWRQTVIPDPESSPFSAFETSTKFCGHFDLTEKMSIELVQIFCRNPILCVNNSADLLHLVSAEEIGVDLESCNEFQSRAICTA